MKPKCGYLFKYPHWHICMQLKERILELESSDAFLEWKKINKDSYLAHIFFDESGHQFGYYNTDDTVTSFTFRDGTVNHDAGQKIFKANADPLVRLDVSRVEKGFPDCIQKAKDYLAKKYPSQSALKFFAILQEIKKKAVFNITLF